jgi:thiosulfate reductase cytochrome b subunit
MGRQVSKPTMKEFMVFSMMTKKFAQNTVRSLLLAGFVFLSLAAAALFLNTGFARANRAPAEGQQISPLHPSYALLDKDGVNVLESGQAISTMQTCGSCHDADFIAEHSFHASAGLESFGDPGTSPLGNPWDTSTGMFGRWNPLTYRYLTPVGETPLDLTTPDWIKEFGSRHAGGGPAVLSRSGEPLTSLTPDASSPETAAMNPQNGELAAWDWNESGVVEMDCFLCHTPNPNLSARQAALTSGAFGWSATATILGNGVVRQDGSGYSYNSEAFTSDGELAEDYVQIQDPTNENCGACHGLVHSDPVEPLVAAACSTSDLRTDTTGQIISPQRIMDSGLNLASKGDLSRTWDVHAERVVACTDCHFSLNNPIYFQPSAESQPEHLTFDPRRLELGEYLYQPVHQFARGASSQSTIAPELKDTMRQCESCHSIEATHDWLPYKERHTAELSCESCHIPEIYFSALQQVDWTVIRTQNTPLVSYRGVEQCADALHMPAPEDGDQTFLISTSPRPAAQVNQLVTGYTPVLLSRTEADGRTRLAPYNLVTSWFWVYGDPQRPVPQASLEKAWMQSGAYAPEVITQFDSSGDGTLSNSELVIESEAQVQLIASRLADQGLQDPRIVGQVQPYSINHTVTHGDWVTRDCQTCHSRDSRLLEPMMLASYVPAGVLPEFVANTNVEMHGSLETNASGELYYQPDAGASGLYIFGSTRVPWVDILGSLAFVGVLLGIMVHGGVRFYSSLKAPHGTPKTEKVYMYTVYERLWHWLQTITIILLLFTGLVIHRPDIFALFSFRYVVLVHNVLAAILLINAFLALFYHLASGEIKQYIPRVGGFFDQAIVQAQFYMRGIFKGEHHPFEKTPERKLNPLQQVTYFGILNILLPLMVLTGILMWGVQQFPNLAESMGGLPFLAPFHTLIAWLFAAFIVAHVYLTTTGPAPMAGIKAMVVGWDDVEVIEPDEEAANDVDSDSSTSPDPA